MTTRRPSWQRRLGCAIACALLVASCAGAPRPDDCAPAASVRQVADGVYVRRGEPAVVFEADNVANIGFVVGERCVAVIDTGGSVAEGRALDCAIRKVTDRPVCYVVNTHVHPDHLLGNAAFEKADVVFVGHAKLPRALALRGETYLARAAARADAPPSIERIVMPELALDSAVQLDIGGRVLNVRPWRSAHTDNDVSVVDPLTNIAFVGDLVFLDHIPVVDGSINGWIGELKALRKEAFVAIVPGHGPDIVTWPAASDATLGYLRELRAQVRRNIASGATMKAAQANIDTDGPEKWPLYERYQQRNVGAAFAELEWEE